MLEKEINYAVLTPIFPIIKWKHDSDKGYQDEECMFIDVDDCECDTCIDERGFIEPYCTLRLGIKKNDRSLVVRLTPDEAICLAKALLEYGKIVSEISEEAELDELEKMA